MEIISFDSGWQAVDNYSEAAQWVFTRSDDGHVYARVADRDPNPTAFGSFFPHNAEAFPTIAGFLKPLEQKPHFQESWARLLVDSDFQQGVEYLREERGEWKSFTAENVEIFAKLFIACFPVTGHYNDMSQYLYDGFYGFSDDNIQYRPYLSALNYRELVIGVTGVWRKDVARELHEMTIGQMGIINDFSTLVTPENLVEAMSEAKEANGHYDFFTGGFQSLEVLQPSVRVRLLKELLRSMRGLSEDRYIEVGDTMNMLAIVGPHKQFRGCKSWREVHDTAMKLAPTVRGDREVEFPEAVENLSKIQVAGYSFEILTLPDEFVKLGDSLSICIGKADYYFKALRGDSYCFRVLKDGIVIGALEVNQAERVYNDSRVKEWRVAQLYGHGNSELHDKVSLNRFIVGNLNSSNLKKVLERV
jgi:hypothetical protein